MQHGDLDRVFSVLKMQSCAGLVRDQLQSGQSPEYVAKAVMQRMTANQNNVC